MNWTERLNAQQKRDYKNYKKLRIDLSTARQNYIFNIPGDFLYVESASDTDAEATVRLNRKANDSLTLRQYTKIETVYTEIYFTNAAQADKWFDLVFGIDFTEEVMPEGGGGGTSIDFGTARAVVNLTNPVANNDTVPGAQACVSALIKASPDNVGWVWVDFTQAAVQDSCLPLLPGDHIQVNVDNLNIIHANFEVANEVAFILYQL